MLADKSINSPRACSQCVKDYTSEINAVSKFLILPRNRDYPWKDFSVGDFWEFLFKSFHPYPARNANLIYEHSSSLSLSLLRNFLSSALHEIKNRGKEFHLNVPMEIAPSAGTCSWIGRAIRYFVTFQRELCFLSF